MAKVVNTNQQLTHAALSPMSVHSRVLTLSTFVAAGFGNTGFIATPVVADGVRLLSIRLLVMPGTVGALTSIIIYLSTGTGKNVSQPLIATQWEKIMQSSGGSEPAFRFSGAKQELTWNMNKLYSGSGRRFGLALLNLSAGVGADVLVSFQISEG